VEISDIYAIHRLLLSLGFCNEFNIRARSRAPK